VRELHSEIVVEAPIDRVWQILVRFGEYPEWNPFVRSVEGQAEQGAKIKVSIAPPGRRAMAFSPTLLAVEAPRHLRWLGRVGFPGVFDGEHSFTLEPLGPRRTRVVQHERFKGILVPFMGNGMYADTQKGFDELLAALKRRAEARPGQEKV